MTSSASQKRPQPLLNQATIIAIATVAVGAAVTLGIVPAASQQHVLDTTNVTVGAVFTLIATATPLITALYGRRSVTPLAEPRDNAGNPLVPAGSVAALGSPPVPGSTGPPEPADPATPARDSTASPQAPSPVEPSAQPQPSVRVDAPPPAGSDGPAATERRASQLVTVARSSIDDLTLSPDS
jgi:hypothetical protein